MGLKYLLSTINISSRQKTNTETLDLYYALEQMDLTHTHTEHPIQQQWNTHTSQNTHGILSRIDHM